MFWGTFLLGMASALPLAALGLHRGHRAREATAMRLCRAAQEAEQVAVRRLRLAAHELHGIGMTLHGHACHLTASGHPQAADITLLATDVLGMADEIQGQSIQPNAPRAFHETSLGLGSALNEAVAGLTASLGPGRRHWRIAAGVDKVVLRGDLRALRHVLSRVLAHAVRTTRHDDWIDIALEPRGEAVALVIADEGAGSAAPGNGHATPQDSRGIGLRLAMARSLMELHGGQLEIEARTGVGTRVALLFPAARVRLPEPLGDDARGLEHCWGF
jgi:signal transduction histidine kinase